MSSLMCTLSESRPYGCSILYQRGVYPADDFHLVKKYGQTVMLTEDAALVNYLDKILKQVNGTCPHCAFSLD